MGLVKIFQVQGTAYVKSQNGQGAWPVEDLEVVRKDWSLEKELRLVKDEVGLISWAQVMKDL